MSPRASARIPLTVMDHHDPELFGELMAAIERVAATGAFTGGAAVEEFEADYAAQRGNSSGHPGLPRNGSCSVLRIGETAFMDEEKRKAMEFIRAHPRVVLELTAKRFVAFWTGLTNPSQNFLSTDSWLVRFLLVSNTLAAVGALLGIATLVRRRSPYLLPAAAYPVVFPWLFVVLHPNLRYRHPIDPVVLLLMAVAVAAGWGVLWKNRHRRHCGPGDH